MANVTVASEQHTLRADWGLRVRERRHELGYTQEQLAQRVGVDQSTISRVERGDGDVKFWVLEATAHALRTTVPSLFRPDPPGSPSAPGIPAPPVTPTLHIYGENPRFAGRITLTVPETATALGVGKSLVYELVNSGRLPSVRLGSAIRVPVKLLEDFLLEQASVPRP